MTNTKTKHVFQFSYDTKETEGHTIDAEKLGAAIMGTSRALKNADKILNGESSTLDIDVKAHSEGSFVVEFVTYINNAGINPLSALGFIAASTPAITVLGAINQLKSRKIKLVQSADEVTSTITLSDDSTMEVPSNIAEILVNKNVRDNIDAIIKSPLDNATDAKFIIKDEDGEETFVVSDDESSNFKTVSANVVDEIKESEEITNVYFTKINFEGSKSWQIRLPDESLVSITMKDDNFTGRINASNQKFTKNDMFEVKLKTITKHRHGTSPTYKREITQVIRHRVSTEDKII